ncbi:MAG TPA: glycoside hydrolase family 97 N-terminal domain-containing protein, partial [Spirochaetota bacterium]|nr:glycoside hydrolase family 97 N-terminal domain-containing protein [Spirochaetota bacterium]
MKAIKTTIVKLISMTLLFVPVCFISLKCADKAGQSVSLQSPDGKLVCSISKNKSFDIVVRREGKPVITLRNISIVTDQEVFPSECSPMMNDGIKPVERTLRPAIAVKRSVIHDNYNTVILDFAGECRVELRVYNKSVAYRFETISRRMAAIEKENCDICFESTPVMVFQKEDSFETSREGLYEIESLSDIDSDALIPTPVIAKNKDGLSVVIAESDRKDYPGLWLRKSSDRTLRADFSPAVKDSSKYDKKPEYENHIAETTMNRKFPWRIFSVHDKESSIAEDQIVETLAHTDNPEAFTWV